MKITSSYSNLGASLVFSPRHDDKFVNLGEAIPSDHTSLTYEFWVKKYNNTSALAMVPVGKGAVLINIAQGGGSGKPGTIGFGTAIGGTQEVVNSGVTLFTNTWSHLAYTFDGTWHRLYLNGSEIASLNKPGTQQTGTSNTIIGKHSASTGWALEGEIANLRVWTYCRTQKEIQNNMRKTILVEEGLRASYTFSDTSNRYKNYAQDNFHGVTGTGVIGFNTTSPSAITDKMLAIAGNRYVLMMHGGVMENTAANIPMLNDHTVSFWVKPVELANYTLNIGITKDGSVWGADDGLFEGTFGFHTGSGGQIWAGSYIGAKEANRFALGAGTLQLDRWDHITYTYNFTTKEAKVYKNGALLATKTFIDNPTKQGVVIKFQTIMAYVDDFRVYSSLKSEKEVSAIYNRMTDMDKMELWWKFDNNSVDSSGKNRDAVSSGSIGYNADSSKILAHNP